MAEKKSNKTISTKESTNNSVQNTTTNGDNELITKLMAEIEGLKKQINQSNNSVETLVQEEEKMIKFISLARGSVMLKGTANKPYEIEGRFNYRMFSESEAKAIVNLMGNYMREGFVYIDDANFVKSVGLNDAYKHMLTPEILKDLFEQSPNTVISAYENATDGQKQIIIDMVYEKIHQGQNIDANILTYLDRIAGTDLLSELNDTKN